MQLKQRLGPFQSYSRLATTQLPRSRHKPQPAGRQRYGRELFHDCIGSQTAGIAARAGSERNCLCHDFEPEESKCRCPIERCTGCCSRSRATDLGFNASTENEIDAAFTDIAKQKFDALLVGTDPFFTSQRDRLVALAARNRIPAVYSIRDYAQAGGLMSYGASLTTHIVKPVFMLAEYSKEPNLPTCQ